MAKKKAINKKKYLESLEKIRESIKKRGWKFDGMTKDEIIEEMRKTRERLWEKKLAGGPRRK